MTTVQYDNNNNHTHTHNNNVYQEVGLKIITIIFHIATVCAYRVYMHAVFLCVWSQYITTHGFNLLANHYEVSIIVVSPYIAMHIESKATHMLYILILCITISM